MALEIRDLKLIEAIAEHGSLTRAGVVLHLTQSAMSRQLGDLERRLDTKLFVRAHTRMSLTPAGERIRETSHELLDAVARVEAAARAVGSRTRGVLRLSTECYTAYHWLPGVFRAFRERFPDVQPQIVAEATLRPLTALLSGQLDLAIVSSPVRNRRVRTIPLFRDEFVAIVAPDHPWARKKFVVARDFATEHVVMYTLSREESTLFAKVLTPARVEPRAVSRVPLTEAIVELVKAGVGVGLLARWAIAPHADAGTLVPVRVTEAGLIRQWSAAFLRGAPDTDHLEGFATLVKRELAGRAKELRRLDQ